MVSLYYVRLGGSRARFQQHLVQLGQRRHGSSDGQWQVAGAYVVRRPTSGVKTVLCRVVAPREDEGLRVQLRAAESG